MLLCKQPPNRLTSASKDFRFAIFDFRLMRKSNRRSQIKNPIVLAGSRTQSSTFAESRAIPHTPRTISNSKSEISNSRIPHRGVEPRLTASKAVVRPSHSQGEASPNCSAKESNLVSRFRRPRCVRHTRRAFQNVLARSRTWSATFGGSSAIRHTPRTDVATLARAWVIARALPQPELPTLSRA